MFLLFQEYSLIHFYSIQPQNFNDHFMITLKGSRILTLHQFFEIKIFFIFFFSINEVPKLIHSCQIINQYSFHVYFLAPDLNLNKLTTQFYR